jgi:hypothetical protein
MTNNKRGWLNRVALAAPNTVRHGGQTPSAPEAPQDASVPAVLPLPIRAEVVRVTPLDESGQPGPESLVRLSTCGRGSISFEHSRPLSARRALVSVDNADFGRLEAEVQLSWCRFNHKGHYTSGGRFVQHADRIA